MQTSERGRALIRQHEGLRLEAYQDPVGVWTIGFGHTSAAGPPAVYKGMRITAAGADEILRTDLRKFEGYVASAVKVPLNQNQFDALVSFTFNLGSENLRSSTLLKRLNAGDYFGAADQFAVWNDPPAGQTHARPASAPRRPGPASDGVGRHRGRAADRRSHDPRGLTWASSSASPSPPFSARSSSTASSTEYSLWTGKPSSTPSSRRA